MRDFFISYSHKDQQWAEWIASVLSDAGYSHYFQKWDFRPGGNFVLLMQKAAADSKRTLIVLSRNYLRSMFTQSEWAAALQNDPTGDKRGVLPVRIERCEVPGLLGPIIYCDLVGLGRAAAKARLLEALPSRTPHNKRSRFPGSVHSLRPTDDPIRSAAEQLQSVLETTRATFIVQVKIRNQLVKSMRTRLRITQHFQYEELFERYFTRLSPSERRLHRIIRTYTESVLYEYNRRALKILQREPRLADFLPSFEALRQHLIVWLQKFRMLFKDLPYMCLLYVGVEEQSGFPPTIEAELKHYLRTGKRWTQKDPALQRRNSAIAQRRAGKARN
jgi:hypothetical protein